MTTDCDGNPDKTAHETSSEPVWLVYDGECPICSAWSRYARIRDAVGELRLVDARHPGALMDEITAAGLDIDQGMVLKFKGTLYYGPDAVWMMSLLGTPSGAFNRFNAWCFGSQHRARIVYPIAKAFRNLVLKALGVEYIGNLQKTA